MLATGYSGFWLVGEDLRAIEQMRVSRSKPWIVCDSERSRDEEMAELRACWKEKK